MRIQRILLPLIIISAWLSGCVETSRWQRNPEPVLTNFYNMYNPCVTETGGDYPYKIWFFGWASDQCNSGYPGCDTIYHARAKDLHNWEVYCGPGKWDSSMNPTLWVPVITASGEWYDAWHNGDPSVVYHEGMFYMAYSATSMPFEPTEGYFASMTCSVMGAVSRDGINWQRSETPLLIAKIDRPVPVAAPGRIGDFHRPSLMREDGKWKLWFDYAVGSGFHMGYAENTGDFMDQGGFEIMHDLDKPLLRDWPNPCVVKYGGKYHCFSDAPGYELTAEQAADPQASGWITRQIREAVSEDGLNWKKLDYIEPDQGVDAFHVPEAFIKNTSNGKFLYLFYATQRGYSTNSDNYDYKYDSIRMMKRRIK